MRKLQFLGIEVYKPWKQLSSTSDKRTVRSRAEYQFSHCSRCEQQIAALISLHKALAWRSACPCGRASAGQRRTEHLQPQRTVECTLGVICLVFAYTMQLAGQGCLQAAPPAAIASQAPSGPARRWQPGSGMLAPSCCPS